MAYSDKQKAHILERINLVIAGVNKTKGQRYGVNVEARIASLREMETLVSVLNENGGNYATGYHNGTLLLKEN